MQSVIGDFQSLNRQGPEQPHLTGTTACCEQGGGVADLQKSLAS